MQIAETRQALNTITKQWASENLEWAFVPTMGALHDGHLTLVKEAIKHFPRVVVSVFVNPTQFGEAADLENYVRQPDVDAEMLRGVSAHAMFLPSVEVIYPDGTKNNRVADLDGLDTRSEGASRPGHFEGVVQVVRRLVQVVNPKAMFMGQKDAQQVAVLKRAAAQEFWPLTIHAVPTVREESGLAMSSRNTRLSSKGLKTAALISSVLAKAEKAWRAGETPRAIEQNALEMLISSGFEPEYFELVNANTFKGISDMSIRSQPVKKPLIVTAAWLEGVRLIDNWPLFLEEKP